MSCSYGFSITLRLFQDFKKMFIHFNFVISQQVVYTKEILSLVFKNYTHIHTTGIPLYPQMPIATEERRKDKNCLCQTVLGADHYIREFKG